MLKFLSLSLFVFFLSGCADKVNYVNKIGEYPKRGDIKTVYTGDVIFKAFDYVAISGAKFKNIYTQKFGLSTLNITPSEKLYSVDKGTYTMYCSENAVIDQVGTSDYACFKDNNGDGYFDEFSNRYALYWTKIDNIQRTKYELGDIEIKSGTKKEILYNGFSNNTLNLEYREFVNNFARPAYYQNLHYQFKGKPIQIRYKDIAINIIDANNNMIKYSIMK